MKELRISLGDNEYKKLKIMKRQLKEIANKKITWGDILIMSFYLQNQLTRLLEANEDIYN